MRSFGNVAVALIALLSVQSAAYCTSHRFEDSRATSRLEISGQSPTNNFVLMKKRNTVAGTLLILAGLLVLAIGAAPNGGVGAGPSFSNDFQPLSILIGGTAIVLGSSQKSQHFTDQKLRFGFFRGQPTVSYQLFRF